MMPIVVTIDDRIPLKNNKSIYSRVGDDKAVWALLIEKAMAYIHGTYEAIEGGNPVSALNTLAGAPGISYRHGHNIEAEELWDKLIALPDNAMLQASTSSNSPGIVGGHAYTLLKAI